jgi:D-cysteine desulfhydrase
MNIQFPARLPLAQLPTPLKPMQRLSEKMGVPLYIKRDDLTGAALSGNKIRKLEFVLAEARAQKADVVLTCGGAQSNHCRATAVAAAQIGMGCRLILRTDDPANPPASDGNILLDQLSGAEIVWITPHEYRQVDTVFQREGALLASQGYTPYVIPEGASNALGAWGYIGAALELHRDLSELPEALAPETSIVVATGSGGTAAGLILGAKLLNHFARVVSINVCDDEAYFRQKIGGICERAIERFNLDIPFDRKTDIHIIDGYVGRGYGLSRPEELGLIRDVARTEGIFLDPTYTGKAFHGMVNELEKDSKALGERIVFVHTGGLFGLFPKANEIEPLL